MHTLPNGSFHNDITMKDYVCLPGLFEAINKVNPEGLSIIPIFHSCLSDPYIKMSPSSQEFGKTVHYDSLLFNLLARLILRATSKISLLCSLKLKPPSLNSAYIISFLNFCGLFFQMKFLNIKFNILNKWCSGDGRDWGN